MTAGTLVASDGETPVGSLFVLEAENRAAIDAFTNSDPYHVNNVWEHVEVHYYNKSNCPGCLTKGVELPPSSLGRGSGRR